MSKTAVSYALNGTGRLGEDTRRRIQKAAAELGYSVHRAAREVATGEAGAIGAVLSPTRHEGETPNYYVAELLAGVEDEARRRQLAVQVAMWDGSTLPMAADGSVDGLLYLGGAFDPAALARLALPAVLVGTSFSEVEMDAVLADNRRGTYLAASHLLAVGCQRLALLNGPHHAPTSDSKWLGFRDALKQRGLDPESFEVAFTEFSPEAGYEAARRLLDVAPPPDGLVVGDDAIAVGALHAAQDMGIEIPAQLAIVGYGDSELGRMLRPTLSSVCVFQRRMGRLAVRRLADRLRGRAEGYIRILVGPELVVRESSQLGRKG